MIQLVATDNILDTIEKVFQKDTQLCMLYHYESPTTYEEAIDFSCEYNSIYVPKGSVFSAIYYYDRIVGFVTIFGDCIWDFHVSKQHRSDIVLNGVWAAIIEHMHGDFHVRLFERNYRDINWLISEKNAIPYKLENKKPGYYTAECDSMEHQGQIHTYFREYSQILLKFKS